MTAPALKRVTSRANPLVARFRAAATGGAGEMLLLDGPHLVTDALDTGVCLRHVLVSSEAVDRPELQALVSRLAERGVDTVAASRQVMDRVSPVRSSSTIVALADRPLLDETRLYRGPAALVLIASNVQDPGNLGAVIRVAEAGGATGVIAAGACTDPFGWKALRGSMGSALRLPVVTSDDLGASIATARRRGCRIIATVPRGGRSLFATDLTRAAAVLIGGEGPGLPTALAESADERVTIPMQSPVESLNTAVAAALVVYEAWRQRTRK